MNRQLVAMGTACGLAMSGAFSPLLAAGTAASPQEFVRQAIAADNSEIMLGALAAERGASVAVRQFGQALRRDHAEAREQMLDVRDTAREQAPSENPTADAEQERVRLRKLSGPAFDRAFVDYMIGVHSQAIATFEAMAKSNQGEVSMIADIQLPTLRRHLRMAQELQADLKEAAKAP
jgi:putative membrane protein